MSIDDNFKRVAPEAYNRMRHPSQKQFHEFVKWLRETTVLELESARGDLGATKAAFIRFFQRGLKAELLLAELGDILPSVVTRADYSAAEHSRVVSMLKSLNLEELGIKCDQGTIKFSGSGSGPTASPNDGPAAQPGTSAAKDSRHR